LVFFVFSPLWGLFNTTSPFGETKKKRRKNKLLFKPAQPVGLTPGLMLATY